MPESGKDLVRLHCICGQKMKISESMYGLPGKCTACKQKVRLPRADELSDGCSDIYLEEHPEFLRGERIAESAPKAPASKEMHVEKTPTPVTELDISDSAESSQQHMLGSVPLDSLSSMQTLASLQLRTERKIQIIDKSDEPDEESRAELKGRLTRIRGMRKDLDEQIHQHLMEVAIKLTNTQEDIADLQLSARVDEVSFADFQKQIYNLRVLRDHLERVQLNLRGWLATVGPSAVGGYKDVTINELPKKGYTLERKLKPEAIDSLINAHTRGLKKAFDLRDSALKKKAEIKKLRKKGGPEERARLKDPYAHAKASVAIAEMQIGFYQQRLKVLVDDHEGDIETLNAQVATARDKLSLDQMDRNAYDVLKQEARHTKTDLQQGCEVARRLLQARSSRDIAEPKGSFIKRISTGEPAPKVRNEKAPASAGVYVLWTTVVLWLLGLFCSVSSEGSLFKAFVDFRDSDSVVGIVLALPILAAAITAMLIFIPQRTARGLGALILWGCSLVLILYCVNEAYYSLDPLAERFRMGAVWFVRPGILAMLLANGVLLAQAMISLREPKALRPVTAIGVIAGLLIGGWFMSNGLGLYKANPDFSYNDKNKRLQIQNVGERNIFITASETGARNGYVLSLKNVEGKIVSSDELAENKVIKPGESIDVRLELAPGEYQLTLKPSGNRAIWSQSISIPIPQLASAPTPPPARTEEPAPRRTPRTRVNPRTPVIPDEVEPEPVPEEPVEPQIPEETMEAEEPVADPLPTIGFKGAMERRDGTYKFSLEVVFEPGEKGVAHSAQLKEELLNEWIIEEYNTRGILTLSRDNDLLYLRRGEKIALPAVEPTVTQQ